MAKALVYCSHEGFHEHLKEALRMYCATQRCLSPKITVHKRLVQTAEAALQALEVNAAIEGLGGCLANEIWL
jgi:hypothetical protein